MQQPPGRAIESDVDIGHSQLDGAVGVLLVEVHVIHTNDLAPPGIDDLLIKQVLPHSQPGLIRMKMFQVFLFYVELDDPWGHRRNLVVTGQQREIFAPA